jgi:branched-chain amino acid transport system ATP-binding protein
VSVLLETEGLTVSYGGVNANEDVRIAVETGKIVGLIGANGAGKTTFVDAITGFAPVTSGSVEFEGQDITRLGPDRRARRGLVRTFQSLELFEDLTVADNLLVACERTRWWSLLRDLLARSRRKTVNEDVEWALGVVGIRHLADRYPEQLSHGQRKLAGLARALVARPKLLLLDEPAAGLDAHESQELSHALRRLLADGLAIFIIDHDMGLMMSVCDYVYVLDFGRIIAHGTPAAIRFDPTVIAAYLGSDSAEVEA